MVQGSGFGFRVQGLGCGVSGLGLRVEGSGFGVDPCDVHRELVLPRRVRRGDLPDRRGLRGGGVRARLTGVRDGAYLVSGVGFRV